MTEKRKAMCAQYVYNTLTHVCQCPSYTYGWLAQNCQTLYRNVKIQPNQTKRNETNECVLVVAVLVFSLENSIREFHSSRRRFIFMAIQSNYKHFNVDNLFISFISFALERFYFCVYQE